MDKKEYLLFDWLFYAEPHDQQIGKLARICGRIWGVVILYTIKGLMKYTPKFHSCCKFTFFTAAQKLTENWWVQ